MKRSSAKNKLQCPKNHNPLPAHILLFGTWGPGTQLCQLVHALALYLSFLLSCPVAPFPGVANLCQAVYFLLFKLLLYFHSLLAPFIFPRTLHWFAYVRVVFYCPAALSVCHVKCAFLFFFDAAQVISFCRESVLPLSLPDSSNLL